MSMREFWDNIPNRRLCRFCKQTEEEDSLVKYGTRHYAHAECLLNAKGGDAFDILSLHQLERFPKDVAKRQNVHVLLQMAIRAERAEYAK